MMKIIQLKSRYERENKLKGYDQSHDFSDEAGTLRWSCDVYGECIKAPSVYKPATDGDQMFKMVAKGKTSTQLFFVSYLLHNPTAMLDGNYICAKLKSKILDCGGRPQLHVAAGYHEPLYGQKGTYNEENYHFFGRNFTPFNCRSK